MARETGLQRQPTNYKLSILSVDRIDILGSTHQIPIQSTEVGQEASPRSTIDSGQKGVARPFPMEGFTNVLFCIAFADECLGKELFLVLASLLDYEIVRNYGSGRWFRSVQIDTFPAIRQTRARWTDKGFRVFRFRMQLKEHFVLVGGDGCKGILRIGGSLDVSVVLPSLVIVVFHLSRGQTPLPALSPFGEATRQEGSEKDHYG